MLFKKGFFDGAWSMQILDEEISIPMAELPPALSNHLIGTTGLSNFLESRQIRFTTSELEDCWTAWPFRS